MTLVDANILMYAAGTPHPNKAPSEDYLQRIADGEIDAVLDAEALQEILHRYRAIRRWSDGRMVYDLARRVFPLVLPITPEVMDRARGLLDQYPGLAARDAVHVAVAQIHSLDGICSYDRDLDAVSDLRRVEP